MPKPSGNIWATKSATNVESNPTPPAASGANLEAVQEPTRERTVWTTAKTTTATMNPLAVSTKLGSIHEATNKPIAALPM